VPEERVPFEGIKAQGMLPETQILVMNFFDHIMWTGYACVEDELKNSSNVIRW
jgi:hypothetical protein